MFKTFSKPSNKKPHECGAFCVLYFYKSTILKAVPNLKNIQTVYNGIDNNLFSKKINTVDKKQMGIHENDESSNIDLDKYQLQRDEAIKGVQPSPQNPH